MELTRRDAVAALGALGAGGAAAVGVSRLRDAGLEPGREDGGELPDEERVRETLVAAAEVLYPSEVTGIDEFVEAFLAGRLDRPEHVRGLRETVATLDDRAESWYDGRFAALSPEDRDSLLREVGADTADEDPEGRPAQRVRYFVVNELLLALYSSPTGAELVGIENPQGHPGGQNTYQRGPRS